MALATDVRYAIRRSLASPGPAAVAIITLALGIGATTAIYSVVDALMLRPPPYGDPARLVDLGRQSESGASRYFDAEQIAELRSRPDLFTAVDAYNFAGARLLGAAEPTQAAGAVVGGDVLRILGVPPQLGRLLDRSDVTQGRQVILLSDALWRTRFGADPEVVGRVVRLDDKSVEIVGVMPPSFKFPNVQQEFWLPFDPAASPWRDRPMFAIARLPNDRTVAEARARVEASTIVVTNRQGESVARPLRIVAPIGRLLNPPVRDGLFLVAGAVGLVLLIACANVANLLLLQNAARYREIAVRMALGASRGTLVRQFLTETALLSIAGGALGLLVAQWCIDILAASAPADSNLLNINAFRIDARVLFFALTATAVVGCLAGILPAVRAARSASHDTLRSGGRSATDGPGPERLRRGFVVLQLAVSVVLLVGATLLGRSFLHLNHLDPGFDPDGLAITRLELPRWKYQTASARGEFFNTLRDRIAALPGIEAAALTGGGGISYGAAFDVEGRGVVADDPNIEVPHSYVAGNYFSVMRIPIVAGRAFTNDDVIGAPRAIVINQAMARRLWRGADPIAQRLRLGTRSDDPWYTVVGVAADTYDFDYARTNAPLTYYLPFSGSGMGSVATLVARTGGEPALLLPLIREQVRGLDSEQPIWKLQTGTMAFAEFLALPRFYMQLMAALAGLGIIIAAVGLYGVLAFAVSRRTREIGVRLALGAQTGDVWRIVLASGGTLTGLGLVTGIAVSLLATRWVESVLVDVPRLDVYSYAGAACTFGLTALLACWAPARRATRVDPIEALRSE